MEMEILLSCMYENGVEMIKRSNLQACKTLIINQTNIQNDEKIVLNELHRVINTNTRGLSISRNIGIKNAEGDICLLADNDEVFVNGLEDIICRAYDIFPDADIIIFKLKNKNKLKGNKPRRLKKYDMLRVASWMITFKREPIVNYNLLFDPILGAGTGNGGGEEIKFLFDCFKKKLRIYYVPDEIGELISGPPSTWFNGFNEEHFYKWGCVMRYILGYPMASLYSAYTLIKKYKLYKSETPISKVAWNMIKGNLKGKKGLRVVD